MIAMQPDVNGRTSLARLRRRANTVFDESCDVMRTSIMLRLQNAHIRAAMAAGAHFERARLKPAGPGTNGVSLTPRERAVLEMVVQGKTTKSIAMELGISFKTAASHRYNAMSKMGVTNCAALVRDSLRLGLIQDK